MAYHTKQSACVLEILEKNQERHLTAEEIYWLLKSSDTPVGQTTVYRQLDKLVRLGKVRKFARGDSDGACYQLVPVGMPCQSHFHLKCTSCGKLFHADCEFLEQLGAHIAKEHQFTIDPSKTVFYGLCADCAKEKTQS